MKERFTIMSLGSASSILFFFLLMGCVGTPEKSQYTLQQYARLEGVRNLSGITYCPDSDTFLIITNGPTHVHRLTPEGKIIQSVDLVGFDDTEGIVLLNSNLVAVIEERERFLNIFQLMDDTTEITKKDVLSINESPFLGFWSQFHKNKGPEGIAFDSVNRKLIICEEKNFSKSYSFNTSSLASSTPEIYTHGDLDDISGLHFADNQLMVLSEESRRIIFSHPEGGHNEVFDLRSIDPEKRMLPHPEGLTMRNGALVVVSEPNHFAVLARAN